MIVLAAACSSEEAEAEIFDPEPAGEGVAFDEENEGADVEGKADAPQTYQVPTDLPQLERPEIIVALETKTVHLFDRTTGFSAVYPAGPGALRSDGTSMTPSGFFKTGSSEDPWYHIERRATPDYFGGFPFLRITALNSRSQHTYGLHGPISYSCPGGGGDCAITEREWFLRQDFVSHGCVRMAEEDIVDLFWMVRDFDAVPVAIVAGSELDAAGAVVDEDADVTLWAADEAITYAECGSRDDPWLSDDRWPSDDC